MNEVGTTAEFTGDTVDLSDDSTTVTTNACIVRGVYVNTVLSSHECPIKDDTTTKFTLPAALAAGTFVPFGDTMFNTSLVVDPDDSATGDITVIYKPIL